MATAVGEEQLISGGAGYTVSTNWIVTRGSLEDVFSFDTSADEGLTASASSDLLLVQPSSNDPPPCEVTVYFREKHEVHRVYVRSTAHTYEIYYGSNQQNNKEYLCTVRCGAVSEEVYLGLEANESNSEQGDNGLPREMTRSDSSSSAEDGWVEVKIPGTVKDDRVKSSPVELGQKYTSNFQMHYEATAEISDAGPCIALTLRFLSLPAKGSAHIEEIYIYADPVDSTDPDSSPSVRESAAKDSLLTLLVPSLMQLSKSTTARSIENKSGDLNAASYDKKAANRNSMDKLGPQNQGACSSVSDKYTEAACDGGEVTLEDIEPMGTQGVSDQDHRLRTILEDNNLFHTHIETILDKLTTKVERIEDYCSKFEENLMRPLSGIEMRLQLLEQQLATLNARANSSDPVPSLKISVPEFSSDESDSEDVILKSSLSLSTEMIASDPTQEGSSLIVKAPEFSCEDDENTNEITHYMSQGPSKLMQSDISHENDEIVNETSGSLVKGAVRVKATSSIDNALASALEALVTTTCGRYPKLILDVTEEPVEVTKTDSATDLVSGVIALEDGIAFKDPYRENHEVSMSGNAAKSSGFDSSLRVANPFEASWLDSETFPDTDRTTGLYSAGITSEGEEILLHIPGRGNRDASISGDVEKALSSGSSSQAVDTSRAPLSDSKTSTTVILVTPEFPNGHSAFIGFEDKSSDNEVKDDHLDLGLAAYLASSIGKSVSFTHPLIETARKGFNSECNESISHGDVSCEEHGLEITKHVNNPTDNNCFVSAHTYEVSKTIEGESLDLLHERCRSMEQYVASILKSVAPEAIKGSSLEKNNYKTIQHEYTPGELNTDEGCSALKLVHHLWADGGSMSLQVGTENCADSGNGMMTSGSNIFSADTSNCKPESGSNGINFERMAVLDVKFTKQLDWHNRDPIVELLPSFCSSQEPAYGSKADSLSFSNGCTATLVGFHDSNDDGLKVKDLIFLDEDTVPKVDQELLLQEVEVPKKSVSFHENGQQSHSYVRNEQVLASLI